MINTAQQLVENYGFSEEIADYVEEVAQRQRGDYPTSDKFLEAMGAGTALYVTYDGYQPTQVLDIRPKDCDPRHALIVDIAMANALDDNQKYQVATIAHANPGVRVVAFGNPSVPFTTDSSRRLKMGQLSTVAGGDFAPSVDPVLKYLEKTCTLVADHYGYSYGEATALDAITRGPQAETTIILDPATTYEWNQESVLRGLVKLGLKFNSTAAHLEDYVQESGIDTFLEAREKSPSKSYPLGIALRLSNMATAIGLSRAGFTERASAALIRQPDMQLHAAWGIQSEFNIDGSTSQAVAELEDQFGNRVTPRPLEARHAVANNVFFQAALVREALAAA